MTASSKKGGGKGPGAPGKKGPGAVKAADQANKVAKKELSAGAKKTSATQHAKRVIKNAQQALEVLARAGNRSMRRPYPQTPGGVLATPLGRVTTRPIFERNAHNGRKVDYVSTDDKDFKGSKGEPKRYGDIAKNLTPIAAQAALQGPKAVVKGLTPDQKRAAATANALITSEDQRDGGGKHARAALRTVAQGELPASTVYAGANPAFLQSAPKGMKRHRQAVESGTLSAHQMKVVENFSDSSGDEAEQSAARKDAVKQYRRFIETKGKKPTK